MQQTEPTGATEPAANPSAAEDRRGVAKRRGVSVSPVPWKCKLGHVLGHVAPVEGIRRLFLYRFADVPENIAGILTGLGCWTCSKCNSTREWHAGQDAIEELLALRKRHREVQSEAGPTTTN